MADYEESERIAIDSGKAALDDAPWLSNRKNSRVRGFFFDLLENEDVYPDHYSIHCVDGVGTKLFLGPWSGDYASQAQDGIAMSANDMATALRADIDVVNLYFAMQTAVEEEHMGEIMQGFVKALKKIKTGTPPNIGKIETASLDEMISLGVPNKGWDVAVAMSGFIKKLNVPNLDPQPGNVIVGVASTGLHSNGYTDARHVLFVPDVEHRPEWRGTYKGRFGLHDTPDILDGMTVLNALKVPTALYFKEARQVGESFDDRDIYGINITGNGILNFNRAGRDVSFEITDPLDPLPIHELLLQESSWSPNQAYIKSNMGMGFAYVAPDLDAAELIVDLLNRATEKAKIIGEVKKSSRQDLVTRIHAPYEGRMLEFAGYNN